MTFKDCIMVDDRSSFDINHILECGQIFRYELISDNCYRIYSQDKVCIVQQHQTYAKILCDDKEYFYNFFDLGVDYSNIKSALYDMPFMKNALDFGYGIRILRQDPWEMLISFIISANNHIPRIKKIIKKLCDEIGESSNGYKCFPTPQAMASQSIDFFKGIGAGYRAKYLHDTSKAIASGFDLQGLYELDSFTASKRLCTLMGVGEKVADCILLFGYYKQDVFPVDTWIKKVFSDIVPTSDCGSKKIRKNLVGIYGDLSGYAQQYLFFHKRELR